MNNLNPEHLIYEMSVLTARLKSIEAIEETEGWKEVQNAIEENVKQVNADICSQGTTDENRRWLAGKLSGLMLVSGIKEATEYNIKEKEALLKTAEQNININL